MKASRTVAVSTLLLLLSACGGVEEEAEDYGPDLPWSVDGQADAFSFSTAAAYFSADRVTAYAKGTLDPRPLAAGWKKAGLNAVVLDVREGDGIIRFDLAQDGPFLATLSGLATILTQNTAKTPAALDSLVQMFQTRGLKVILRLVLF